MATLKDMLDNVRAKSADAFENISNGLRGQANPGAAAAAAGTAMVPYNPVQGQRPAPPAATSATNAAAKGSRLARGLRSLGAGGAAYAGVKTAFDAAKEGNTDSDYAAADTTIGKLITGGPIALMSDSFAHATSPIRAAMVGAGRRFANNLNPFASEAQAANPVIKTHSNDLDAELRAGAPEASEDTMIQTTRGGLRTPQQMIDGTDVPVAGQGAFQRTTPGNRGVATKVGARLDEVKPGAASTPIRTGTAMGDFATALTRVKAAQQDEAGQRANRKLGIESAKVGATVAKTQSELDKAKNESIDKHIENEVLRSVDPASVTETQGDYKSRVDKARGELASRIAHSAANRGVKRADLTEIQIRQLATGNKIRNAVEKDWNSLSAGLRDLLGNKRFVSDDLFSYIPEVKDSKVHFGGNVIPVSKVMGGGFNLLSPNDPVDRDVMEMIKKAIERSEKGTK